MSKIRVKFKTTLSCMEGSFATDQIVDIEERLATPWLKAGTVELAQKAEVTKVEEPSVVTASFLAREIAADVVKKSNSKKK